MVQSKGKSKWTILELVTRDLSLLQLSWAIWGYTLHGTNCEELLYFSKLANYSVSLYKIDRIQMENELFIQTRNGCW